jgi:hypothetical protein
LRSFSVSFLMRACPLADVSNYFLFRDPIVSPEIDEIEHGLLRVGAGDATVTCSSVVVELTENTDDRFAADLILGKVHLDMFFRFVFWVRLQVRPTG